ncbi:type II toxin-antitoxin system RelE/ParE family toxin [Aliirhizobium terrae]|uniref:type II toxin-antitoxin system RelE/ParE family toxin n=1 Tax=Terrirhizobium terrae TaxID=2926709 RepID=UPI0025768922|nr:type II toxin-antitoxin system RelE/ParE family toxin [Rhizobium sp. CC-CFT758]WJH41353.1 type II toxin-antitoxin system RelE/ParE family toxin [Rhizobium sp. CC-CFT758]
MKALVFSPKAEADIDDIYDYTEQHWGFENAEVYTFELRDACRSLVEGPRHGRKIGDEIRRNYFVLSCKAHFIIYRETVSRIVIVRILHQRMNVRRHL